MDTLSIEKMDSFSSTMSMKDFRWDPKLFINNDEVNLKEKESKINNYNPRNSGVLKLAEIDTGLQLKINSSISINISNTFEGLNNHDNKDFYGFNINPPDANGAVGPDHYIQTV